ncbi:MAG: glycosyltransferase family 2 protein [Oscillibacter sp.]|nr:glycosyltransferase family 2 protein [Oscillibacter sp.]
MVTIFTPTYNRAYIIGKLYQSLLEQTDRNFEWLVVDDGSTDNTEELIASFIQDNNISIRYFRQKNAGKHRAINKGLSEAKGELFFVVDSDDYLPECSLQVIMEEYSQIKNNPLYAGVTGLKCYPSGEKVGGEEKWDIIDSNSLEIRLKYKVKGDLADVLKTDIAKKYPFPEIESEKFCPEALVYNRLSNCYKIRYFYKNVYFCDYLPDGLTAKITRIRKESPLYSMTYYSEYSKLNIPIRYKLKGNINYWRFSRMRYLIQDISRFQMRNLLSLVGFPVGMFMKLKDVL